MEEDVKRLADCDDTDVTVYPDAPEVNNGLDEQCLGDVGYGVIDEVSGDSGFHNPSDRNEYSWTAQSGATEYQTMRSSTPTFTADCTGVTTTQTDWIDTEALLSGKVRYYLVRPTAPNVGSWGADSSGVERTVLCGG